MKALSLWQPWATLVALGLKRIETRSWSTQYRGGLAIHAAQRAPTVQDLRAIPPAVLMLLADAGIHSTAQLPRGCYVALAELVDVLEMTPAVIRRVRREGRFEVDLGDWRPGRHAWLLQSVRALNPPRAARGRQGLFDAPEDLDENLAAPRVTDRGRIVLPLPLDAGQRPRRGAR